MTAVELIYAVEANGGRIRVDGPDLVIAPRSAAASVRAQLIENKQAIIDLLSHRHEMPPGALLISWQPKAAPVELSPCSTVTVTPQFIDSTLRQLGSELRGDHWGAGNWPLRKLLDRLAACGVVLKINDPKGSNEAPRETSRPAHFKTGKA